MVPVTAKLSKQFYDRLGDQVANELVEWFNQVDATYRSDLREMNELNFSRFDAKVEQRFAEQDARIDRRFAEFEVRIERRMAAFEVRIEQRMAEFEVRVEQRIAEFEVRVEQRLAAFEVRIEKRLAAFEVSMRAEMEKALREHTRLLFLGWVTLLATILPLWFR